MIEVTLLRWLEAMLPDPVYLEKRPKAPARRYIIEKLGGGRRDQIRSAVIAVQSCAPTLLEAIEMNRDAIEAMRMAVKHRKICDVQLNADYNFTDTDSKGYRYQAVFDIYYKE